MSRQQIRANERRRNKTAFQKICLAAGEGVGKAVAFSFALASNAFAAEPKKEEPIALPPVVVQDQGDSYVVPESSLSKFPLPLKDIAQSITIVPEKLIQEQAGTTLRDALRNVPGITVAAGEGGGAQGDVFILRGFNARNDMFIDGVRDSGSYFRDSFNLDAVEVLKGPSSTFFGRGSTGGIINQVSKVPRLDPSYDGIFSAGAGPILRGTIDVNQPIPQVLPNAALRINLMAHRDDVVGRDKVELERLGFAPSIAFGLGTPTQLTLSYLLQHEDNIPDYGFPYVNGAPLRIDRRNFYGLTKEDIEKTWVNIGTLRLDHRFNDIFNVRNTVRYSHVDRDSAVTNATAVLPNTLNRSRPQRDTQESILSNQTDLTAKFDTYGLKHTATTGLEVSRETFDLVRWASTGPNTTINNPNNNQLPALKTLAADSDTTAIGFGIYAADQIKLNQYFDIVGGVRWDYFDANVDDNFLNDKRKQIDKAWSYRGGLVFHPTASQSYYFSYGSSFNPSAEGIALSPATNGTPPEKNEIFEFGAKIEFFQGALSLQSAVFRIEKTNARTPNPDDPTLPNVITGKQRSQGFEIGATGRVLPGLNVFGGYTFLDTEILKDNAVPSIVGNEISNVPKHSATLWTTYDFLEKWQVGGGPSYVGSRYSNNANTNRIPGFLRWDSTIAYQITKNIQLRVNAINLTNQLYFDSVSGSKAVPAAGRTFIGSMAIKFYGILSMIVQVPNVLQAEQVARCRKVMNRAAWIDGRVTAGYQSAVVKNNRQLSENSPEARELGDMIVAALERNPLFITAALPLRVFPPLFNRYEAGETFGVHLDNSIRQVPGTAYRIRTDISATLFLTPPEDYDGGELVIDDVYGAHAVKLPAGDMVVYPASSLHHVNPVTRGVRLASFFWVQSMVRDDGERTLLFDLDMAINKVNQALPNHGGVVELTNCYHNLLRRFAEV